MKHALLVALILLVAPGLAGERTDKSKSKEPTRGSSFKKLTYEMALEKARSEKKILLVHFYADWCRPCRAFGKETFAAGNVAQFLREKTIAIKINTDDNGKLAREHQVEEIPCIVFLDGQSREVGRLVGFRTPEQFLQEAARFAK